MRLNEIQKQQARQAVEEARALLADSLDVFAFLRDAFPRAPEADIQQLTEELEP